MSKSNLFKLLAILVIASLALAACGGNSAPQTNDEKRATQNAAPAATEAPLATEAPALGPTQPPAQPYIPAVLQNVTITVAATKTTCDYLIGWGSTDNGVISVDLKSDKTIGYKITYDQNGVITVNSRVGASTENATFKANEGFNTLTFELGEAFWNMVASKITVVTNVMYCEHRLWSQINPLPVPDIQVNP
jgi:hypothetical protein